MPQIRTAAADAPSLDAELFYVLTETRPPRLRPGRPPRNAYTAAEVAYMCDIEGRSLLGNSLGFGLRAYLGEPALQDVTGPVPDPDDSRGALRSKTVERCRGDGRRILAALGAWPWAVVPVGRLPRTWRRELRFAEALAGWCQEG